MKLYQPDECEKFVFAVTGKGDRDGSGCKYISSAGGDIDSALNNLVRQGWKPAAPYVMGKFDHLGRYETYCPPVEGIRPGKFVLHPLAEQEYKAARAY